MAMTGLGSFGRRPLQPNFRIAYSGAESSLKIKHLSVCVFARDRPSQSFYSQSFFSISSSIL